jgi:hypothetical protein
MCFAPLAAQTDESVEETGPAGSVEAHLGVTRIAGLSSGWAGVSTTLHLGSGLRVGGGFWGVLRQIDDGPAIQGSGLELGMGYGGLFVERVIDGVPVVPRVLIGGGAATLRNVLTDARFDTETFIVVEPGLSTEVGLPGPFSAGFAVGYRWIRGANEIFLVGDDDLHGVRGSVFLRLGGTD